MEAITLINPKGQKKDFTNVEFYGFKDEVSRSQSFLKWAQKNSTGTHIMYNGATHLNVRAIERFLHEVGYVWIENFNIGKNTLANQKK